VGGYSARLVHAIAGLLVLASAVVMIGAAERSFRKSSTPVRPVSPATAVVAVGPYRISRNPMYLGMVGMVCGAGMITGNHIFLPVVLALGAALHFGAVLPEERYLRRLFPAEFASYANSVRRWL